MPLCRGRFRGKGTVLKTFG